MRRARYGARKRQRPAGGGAWDGRNALRVYFFLLPPLTPPALMASDMPMSTPLTRAA